MTSGDDLRKIGTGSPGRGHRHEVDRLRRIRILAFSMWGGVLGFAAGLLLAMRSPAAPGAALYPLLGGALGWGAVALLVAVVVGGAGGLAGTIYMPGGSGGGRREYSLAESLAARGMYEDAVSAFELAVGEHPDDPLPYLRIARIRRDHLADPEGAARWLKRARDESGAGEAQRRVVTRELVELFVRSGQPTRAAPELARLAELHPETPEGRWARDELAEVKKLISEERS